MTILDTGPLVAFLDRNDKYHSWSVEQFRRLPAPLLTCEPVLTEALFLLRTLHGGRRAVGELLRRKVIALSFRLDAQWDATEALMRKYESLPASLADACLIRMTELHRQSRVFTVDSDFRIYRKNGRAVIPLIIP